jgi:hypothetical protein
MALNRHTLRQLIALLDQEHGQECGLSSIERFTLAVRFDDGAEYRLRWPRGVPTPAWEVARER